VELFLVVSHELLGYCWRGLSCSRSSPRLRPRPEEYFEDLVPADHTDEFVHGAVHQNQHDQENLDRPEMRPDDLCEQLLVARDQAPGLPPEVDQAFQIGVSSGYM
jgi:hypothetical protein